MPAQLPADRRPWLLDLRSSPTFIVSTASFACFTDVFLYCVVVPVLPFSFRDRIGVPHDDVQHWVSVSLTVFAAANVVAAPLFGYIADRTTNRRQPMLFGLALLLAATILLCASQDIPMLMAGRVLQGTSGGVVWSASLALVTDTVDRNRIGEAMGWTGSAISLGALVGPMVGGVVYAKSGYYPVFIICFAVIALDVIMRLAIIEKKQAGKWLANSQSGNHDDAEDTSEDTTCSRDAGASVAQDEGANDLSKLADTPRGAMGVMHLLTKPRLLAALWGCIVESSIYTAFDSVLPLFVESTFGWDSVGAGLIFLPIVLPTFSAPVAGAIVDRFGSKWMVAGGFLVASPILICLRFVTENTIGHQILLCCLLAGIGLCMACLSGPLMAEVTWSIQEDSTDFTVVPYAFAYGLYTVAFASGSVIGPVFGGILSDKVGWGAVGLSLSALTAFSSLISAAWTGGSLRLKTRQNFSSAGV